MMANGSVVINMITPVAVCRCENAAVYIYFSPLLYLQQITFDFLVFLKNVVDYPQTADIY
jgi:hypothetical protein